MPNLPDTCPVCGEPALTQEEQEKRFAVDVGTAYACSSFYEGHFDGHRTDFHLNTTYATHTK